MRRRTLLKASCGAVTALNAGCVSSVGKFVDPSVQLGFVGISNADPESAHVFDLEVEKDGEIVHRSTHELEAATRLDPGLSKDGAVADCEWGSAAGDYTVRVRTDQSDETERSVTEFAAETGADCVIADAEFRNHDAASRYQSDESLSFHLRECDRWKDDYEEKYLCDFMKG